MEKTILNRRYEILRTIGQGGMAEVYLAHDILLDRNVAIKMLRDQFVADKALLEQFRREAKSAAKLVHPYITNIYDVVSEGDKEYIVMEYVEGITLKEYLEDYASPETAKIGNELIIRELEKIPNEKTRAIAKEYIENIHKGKRDFRF